MQVIDKGFVNSKCKYISMEWHWTNPSDNGSLLHSCIKVQCRIYNLTMHTFTNFSLFYTTQNATNIIFYMTMALLSLLTVSLRHKNAIGHKRSQYWKNFQYFWKTLLRKLLHFTRGNTLWYKGTVPMVYPDFSLSSERHKRAIKTE